jgi:hypothetical protein
MYSNCFQTKSDYDKQINILIASINLVMKEWEFKLHEYKKHIWNLTIETDKPWPKNFTSPHKNFTWKYLQLICPWGLASKEGVLQESCIPTLHAVHRMPKKHSNRVMNCPSCYVN